MTGTSIFLNKPWYLVPLFLYMYWLAIEKYSKRGIFQDILMPLNGFLPGTLASNAFKLLKRHIILKSFTSFEISLEFILCGWNTFGQYYISFFFQFKFRYISSIFI